VKQAGGSTMRMVATALVLALTSCAKPPPPRFVYFDMGIDRPRSEDDVVQAGRAAETLQGAPRLKAAVIGYASSEGTPADNQKLSFRRAEHVRDLLVHGGIANDRLTVAARGADDPAASNATEEGRAKNRRVEIFFYDPGRGELQAQYGVKLDVEAQGQAQAQVK
jgi:flagellar motor protein MotB